MNQVPAYLLVYLFRIRAHAGELGYFKRRLENKTPELAVYEKSMLEEAVDLHLVALSDQQDVLVFNPLAEEACPGVTFHHTGTEKQVEVPNAFIFLARGHYIALEVLADAAKWLVASLVGALIALLVSP